MLNVFEASRIQSLNYSKQVDLILSDGILLGTVKGLHSDHNQGINPDTGNPMNARNAHASIHEDELTDKGFGHKLVGHTITYATSKYVVSQTFPDVTTGLIVCILKDVK